MGEQGYYDDPDIVEQYVRARYDPGTARWLGQDPVGVDAGDPNLYRYVKNVTTSRFDASGLAPTGPSTPRIPPLFDPPNGQCALSCDGIRREPIWDPPIPFIPIRSTVAPGFARVHYLPDLRGFPRIAFPESS